MAPPTLAGVRHHLEDKPELLAHGPAAVLHAIADTVVDQYLDVVTAVVTDVDEAKGAPYAPQQAHDICRVYRLKRELLELRRAVAPLVRPMLQLAGGRLPGVDKDTPATSATSTTTSPRPPTASRLSAKSPTPRCSSSSRRPAFSRTPTVPIGIVGVYGMNFDHMPELRWTFGYPLAIGVIIVVCAVIYRVFRRNGWLWHLGAFKGPPRVMTGKGMGVHRG
ncbi:CorA family divalent cation transporter [Streptomyces sp. NPDC005096]|uniref:CorA family divalent cation transporter n=1 Tax=Streptomyces sp. NPDC005096 TaxID=3154559 RepID=UPI00339FCB52